jgi:hypothetical protein
MKNNLEIKVTHWTGEEITCSVKEKTVDGNLIIYKMDKKECNELHASRYSDYAADTKVAEIWENRATGTIMVFDQHKINGKWGGPLVQSGCPEVEIDGILWSNKYKSQYR